MTAQLLSVSRDQVQGNTEISAPIEDVKPWERQKNEPARWFLRFQIYKDAGSKRSLRAAIEQEQEQAKATIGNKKQREKGNLSNVSVPGAWSRSAKLWRWQERAQAWDLDKQKKRAEYFQEGIFGSAEFASATYRIFELNRLAGLMAQYINHNANKSLELTLQCIRHQQSLLKDIASEMSKYPGIDLEKLDADIANYLPERKASQKEASKR